MRSAYLEPDVIAALRHEILNAPRTRRRAWLPFAVQLETGLRIGDVVALRTSDLYGNELHYISKKTEKQGSAVLSAELAAALKEQANGVWLFPSPYNGGEKHLTRQAAWKRIKTAAQRASVTPEGTSPHSMRKVFAVELCAREGLGAVQQALQHSRVDVTEIYALSDFLSKGNAALPLTRADVPRLLQLAVDAVRAMLSVT